MWRQIESSGHGTKEPSGSTKAGELIQKLLKKYSSDYARPNPEDCNNRAS
jgi:hypothetical protein